MSRCIACSDTGVNSKGSACAACIVNARGLIAPRMKGSVLACESESEPIVPIRSIVKIDKRYGIIMGYVKGKYNIAVVVDGEHVGNENWFRRDFDVIRKG